MQHPAGLSSKGTVYSDAQVLAQWASSGAEESWVFDRLDASGRWLSDLTPFVDWDQPPEITHDTDAQVKRTITLRLKGEPVLNQLKDLIKAHYRLAMPDGGYVDYPLGVFSLMPASKEIYPSVTWQMLAGMDFCQLLVDCGFVTSFGVTAGTNYIAAINQIVASMGASTSLITAPFGVQIPDPGISLPQDLGWEAGKTRLEAINQLLTAINYFPAWFDENGVMRSAPIPDYQLVRSSYAFDATKAVANAVMPIVEDPNLANAYNIATVTVEDARSQAAFSATYSNHAADSPVSIENWHPKPANFKISNIADQATAYAAARALCQQAAQLLIAQTFNTMPWPWSQDRDIYGVIFNANDEQTSNYRYLERKWIHRCRSGALTEHTFDRLTSA